MDRRFAEELYGQAFATARLATFLIGRWIATDQVASEEDEAVMTRQGEQAILENTSLGSAAKAYLAWRDCTIAVLTEEAHRLAISDEVLALACGVVRLSSDGSLVRIVRQFDETRRMLQRRLDEEQESLADQALHDQLTGLPNRALLSDRLGQARASLERSRSGAMILYLDLDNFKAVNDRFGHAAGDCLLVAVADRLQALVRSSDTVARLGGDEFVVLAEGLDDPELEARTLAERIHVAMRSPVAMGERQLYTSVSIGIAQVTSDASPEVNLSRAGPMYQAKRADRPATSVTTRPWVRTVDARATWPTNCRRPTGSVSSPSTTSPCSGSEARWWGWRRCCGGSIPSWGRCPRRSSFHCSNGAGRSFRLDDGCWTRPCASAGPGRARASAT